MSEEPKPIKDLGLENEWYSTGYPSEYWDCLDAGHTKEKEVLGSCLTQYTCRICGITYKVDSSG